MATKLELESENIWSKLDDLPLMRRTDNQLEAQANLSQLYRDRLNGKQPEKLIEFNAPERRICKINWEQANQIRDNYIPGVHGKKKLAKEFGVSKAVITRILNNESWKIKS